MEWKQAKPITGGIEIPERWIHLHYYEALNLLFRIENTLRIFVYIVLKNHLRENWVDAQVIGDGEEGTIASLAKKRMSQAQTFGYLGHSIACPVMHLNSGELTRLIVSDSYWRLFKPHFLGSKEIIQNKLDEVGSIRNSLAHFRPIQRDDVDVIKQNSRHFLVGVEQFLKQALVQRDVVPTNTEECWYVNLRTLGNEQCVLSFRQSADGQWVRIGVRYGCPVIQKLYAADPTYRYYAVLTIRSSAVLLNCPEIARNICYMLEQTDHPLIKDRDEFSKALSFVLSRSRLESSHKDLKEAFEELLRKVAHETELIQQDHLARGQLVHAASATAVYLAGQQGGAWHCRCEALETPVREDDPPEYWGALGLSASDDFISATDRYPWMPETVSEDEMPF